MSNTKKEKIFVLIDEYLSERSSKNQYKIESYLIKHPKTFYNTSIFEYACKLNVDILQIIHNIYLKISNDIDHSPIYFLTEPNTGNTLLHITCKHHFRSLYLRFEIVQYLIEEMEIDPNILNNERKTALYYTILNNDIISFKYLIRVNSIINNIDIYNNTPLVYTVHYNNPGMFLILLKKGASVKYTKGRFKMNLYDYIKTKPEFIRIFEKFNKIKTTTPKHIKELVKTYHKFCETLSKSTPFTDDFADKKKNLLYIADKLNIQDITIELTPDQLCQLISKKLITQHLLQKLR